MPTEAQRMAEEIKQRLREAAYEDDAHRKNVLLLEAGARAIEAIGWCPDIAELHYLYAVSWHFRAGHAYEKRKQVRTSLKRALELDPALDVSRLSLPT